MKVEDRLRMKGSKLRDSKDFKNSDTGSHLGHLTNDGRESDISSVSNF